MLVLRYLALVAHLQGLDLALRVREAILHEPIAELLVILRVWEEDLGGPLVVEEALHGAESGQVLDQALVGLLERLLGFETHDGYS